MADVKKIVLCSDANKAAVEAALVDVPGGGIANFGIRLETVQGAVTWWGGSGPMPPDMLTALENTPEAEMYDTDGTAATFYATLAAHTPPLRRWYPPED